MFYSVNKVCRASLLPVDRFCAHAIPLVLQFIHHALKYRNISLWRLVLQYPSHSYDVVVGMLLGAQGTLELLVVSEMLLNLDWVVPNTGHHVFQRIGRIRQPFHQLRPGIVELKHKTLTKSIIA